MIQSSPPASNFGVFTVGTEMQSRETNRNLTQLKKCQQIATENQSQISTLKITNNLLRPFNIIPKALNIHFS